LEKQFASDFSLSDSSREKEDSVAQYLLRRGDNPAHVHYGVSYFVKLADARSKEVLDFLNRNIDMKSLEGKKVLDVGCGSGFLISALREMRIEAYGLDTEPALLRVFGKKYGVAADALCIPFKDETFDAILSLDVIEHLSSVPRGVRSMKSKVSKRGAMIIMANNKLFPFDSDSKLFFVGYMPRKIAQWYVRIRRRKEYDANTPTYIQLKKVIESLEVDGRVVGVFSVLGIYAQKHASLRKLGIRLETLANSHSLLKGLALFAPKIAIIVKQS